MMRLIENKTKIRQLPLILIVLIPVMILEGCASSKKSQQREAKIQTVIRAAKSYTGTPYQWGGMTRTGMDCSGLLINSFRAIDFEIPRTSKQQSELGSKVPLRKLAPGDLVFFATGKKKREITHVGLVTDVRGKDDIRFIHASSSLGVVEANLFTDYYIKRYITARRPF